MAKGPGAQRYPLGQTVTALTPGGGYAEYCRVAETNALPIPDGLTITQVAAVPETYFTVWHNVYSAAG